MSFADPESIVANFGLVAGQEIADFGSGIGPYALACAKIVGQTGKVYAVDIQKDILERLKNDAQKLGLNNVEIIWGDIESAGGVKLKDESLDAIILANALFQAEDKVGVVKEMHRLLRTRGRVFLIDWRDSFGGLGPKPTDVLVPEKAEELFSTNGFEKINSSAGEFSAGDHHYGLIFSKHGQI